MSFLQSPEFTNGTLKYLQLFVYCSYVLQTYCAEQIPNCILDPAEKQGIYQEHSIAVWFIYINKGPKIFHQDENCRIKSIFQENRMVNLLSGNMFWEPGTIRGAGNAAVNSVRSFCLQVV